MKHPVYGNFYWKSGWTMFPKAMNVKKRYCLFHRGDHVTIYVWGHSIDCSFGSPQTHYHCHTSPSLSVIRPSSWAWRRNYHDVLSTIWLSVVLFLLNRPQLNHIRFQVHCKNNIFEWLVVRIGQHLLKMVLIVSEKADWLSSLNTLSAYFTPAPLTSALITP